MPNVTLYVRKEDWDKWQAIEDKGVFLHACLAYGNPFYEVQQEVLKHAEKTFSGDLKGLDPIVNIPTEKQKTFQALKQQFGTADEPHYVPTEE